MSDRRPIVGGNWKMNLNEAGATDLAKALTQENTSAGSCEVVVFPPFVYLRQVERALGTDGPAMGAQDLYFENDGAFTGEISASMLVDCGCRWVLTGHSERRHILGESDTIVNRKTRAALAGGLSVIVCIGETRQQRDAGRTDAVNTGQLRESLADVSPGDLDRIVIAYEPVWAIGTGLTATPQDAQNAHSAIRQAFASMYDSDAAKKVRIQYGGSVKPDNAADLFACPDIDGGLIGGASLKSSDFSAIVQAASGSGA